MEINFCKEFYINKRRNNENCINKSESINQNIFLNNINSNSSFNNNDYTKYNFFNVIHSINKSIHKDNIYTSKEDTKDKKEIGLINFSRSSKYRGVSKNGNKWQVFMMINQLYF